jgi:hypothetical protein
MADSSGNGPERPTQNRLASANTPMAKTALLVVVALIIGIVMINIVGGGGGSTAKTSPTTTPAITSGSTTTTSSTKGTTGGNSTTTTTKKQSTVVPPKSLKLIVVNSGAPKGSGGNVLNALKARGYTSSANTTVAVTWKETGLTVHCKAGLDTERTALVKALAGIPKYTAKAAAYKTEPGVPSADHCYVAIGAVS